jgi:NMD protein affecting ribosome stability and mRNA decay
MAAMTYNSARRTLRISPAGSTSRCLFCGDYREANQWSDEEQQKYRHFLEKRRRMEELERRTIVEWQSLRSSENQVGATSRPQSSAPLNPRN